MSLSRFLQKSIYTFNSRLQSVIIRPVRNAYYCFRGMKIGRKTLLPKIYITWPQQVKIGNSCILESNIYFKFDGIWKEGTSINIGNNVFIGEGCEFNIRKRIDVGDRCLIASGCRFIDHDHGISGRGPIRGQVCIESNIILERDAWLGCNVVVLKGVTIGEGAVIAAGAVVTKSVPPCEIWGGVPAKKIGERY